MINIYLHDYPEEAHLLSCDWNFWICKCLKRRKCAKAEIKGGISVLHGNERTFMENKREPLFHSIYRIFAQTELTSDFDLANLIGRLELELSKQKVTHSSPCATMKGFQELVLRRLLQKLGWNFNVNMY